MYVGLFPSGATVIVPPSITPMRHIFTNIKVELDSFLFRNISSFLQEYYLIQKFSFEYVSELLRDLNNLDLIAHIVRFIPVAETHWLVHNPFCV